MISCPLWLLRMVVVGAFASGFTNDAFAQSLSRTVPAPVMNEELMGRLIKFTRSLQGLGSIDATLCKVFDLCDGTEDMALKLAKSDTTDGEHYFALPVQVDTKDILILVKRDTILEAYLTDKTGQLRAAAVSQNKRPRLITNEKAAEKFEAELALFAKEAAEQLPPWESRPPDKKN